MQIDNTGVTNNFYFVLRIDESVDIFASICIGICIGKKHLKGKVTPHYDADS